MLKNRVIVRVACAIAATILLADQGMATERLRVGGTGATNEMVKRFGALFATESGVNLELVPSLGSSGGNRAVADGVIDLSISGRSLNPAETAKGLAAVAAFHTPFGLVTSNHSPDGFKSSELVQIYQSDRPVWADGKPIRIILRPTNESDTALLGNMFPGMSAAIAKIRQRPDLSIAATDQDNADMAEKTAGSLVASTLTQIVLEKRNLRFVAIDGVEPSLENYEKGTYSFGKKMYLVAGPQRGPSVARFLAFLRSPMGTAALRDAKVILSPE